MHHIVLERLAYGVQQARHESKTRTGRSAAFWWRELRRRRKNYQQYKALTFGLRYSAGPVRLAS